MFNLQKLSAQPYSTNWKGHFPGSLCSPFTVSYTHSDVKQRFFMPALWVHCIVIFFTETWVEMKSDLSTEMLSSPSLPSQTCEYDLCIILLLFIIMSTELQWHVIVQFDCLRCAALNCLCNLFFFPFLQRSEYELSDCDSNDWTECRQSAQTLRESTDEKCAVCEKPTQTQVRKNLCGLELWYQCSGDSVEKCNTRQGRMLTFKALPL